MKPTEKIFLEILQKLGIKNLDIHKSDDKALGSDLINRNIFFFKVMEHLMNDDNLTEKEVGDCDPDSRQSSKWLEPEFNYFGDWIEFENLGLSEIEDKAVVMQYANEDLEDLSDIELDDEQYAILKHLAEGWRDHINEEASCYSGNQMRDNGMSWSDFI